MLGAFGGAVVAVAGALRFLKAYPVHQTPNANDGSMVLVVIMLLGLLLAAWFGFCILVSAVTEYLVNRFGVDTVLRKTGMPFQVILWDELKVKFSGSRDRKNPFSRR